MFNQVLCRWFYYTLLGMVAARCNICEFFVTDGGVFVYFSLQCRPVWWYNKHITQNIVSQPRAGVIPEKRETRALAHYFWRIEMNESFFAHLEESTLRELLARSALQDAALITVGPSLHIENCNEAARTPPARAGRPAAERSGRRRAARLHRRRAALHRIRGAGRRNLPA